MGDDTEAGIKVREDTSLQAWGRNLKHVEPAIVEVRDGYKPAVERDRAAASALTKMAQQADHDLPVAKPLAAEAEALAREAQAIANEAEALQARRLSLANRAAALPKMYDYQHGNDEDRLNEPRNGLAAEARADVRHASQDT